MDKLNESKETQSPRRRVMEVVEIEDDGKDVKSIEQFEQEGSLKKISGENHSPRSSFLKEEPPMKDEKPSEQKRDLVNELFYQKEESNSQASFGYPDISVKSKGIAPSIVVWAVLLIVFIGLIGGALLLYKKEKPSGNLISLPLMVKSTPTIPPESTIEPTPIVDKSKVIVQVLNGSGKAGAASKMKTFLEEKGYTVVETGNAKKYDYVTTEVYVIPGKEVYLDLLKSDLGSSYTVGSTSATLDTTASYSARVIIGKE